ncbi:hypothetical protein GCM10011529_09930 [Polymorphobacter glacialis]|uniref:Uncharacterized protein n=1 Tax=Sandarakinorhabdus glacialis TaxID=1614636 RepID=A0A916ZN33_9SPHN|nr:hypothetical protein [Polymorphobacter glacialis]GGE05560.1 hypothetical protein GCM10011529_09930 [Polymorphobacter glacialis]
MSKIRRPGRRANATGRNEEIPRYVMLHHWLLNSPAYGALRPIARALLVELARRYNGHNNGEIGLGEREATLQLAISDRRAARRAFGELEVAGFIVKTRAGAFNVKTADGRRASEWRLTWLPTRETQATKDFMSIPRQLAD